MTGPFRRQARHSFPPSQSHQPATDALAQGQAFLALLQRYETAAAHWRIAGGLLFCVTIVASASWATMPSSDRYVPYLVRVPAHAYEVPAVAATAEPDQLANIIIAVSRDFIVSWRSAFRDPEARREFAVRTHRVLEPESEAAAAVIEHWESDLEAFRTGEARIRVTLTRTNLVSRRVVRLQWTESRQDEDGRYRETHYDAFVQVSVARRGLSQRAAENPAGIYIRRVDFTRRLQ